MEDPIVKFPETFDGRFYFTNFTNEDFTAKWNSVEYTFPAMKTTPIVIPSESAEAVQSIRKKFARELAEREFYQSDKLKALEDQTPVGEGQNLHSAATYTEADLAPYIQRCLEPLPISAPVAPKVGRPRKIEVSPNTRVLKASATETGSIVDAESLVGNGTVVA